MSHDIKLLEHPEQKDLNYIQPGSRDKHYRKNTSNLCPTYSKLNKNPAKIRIWSLEIWGCSSNKQWYTEFCPLYLKIFIIIFIQ